MRHLIEQRPAGRPHRSAAGRLVAVLALGALTALTGCASRKQMEIVQSDTQVIRAQVDTLKQDQRAVRSSLDSLQQQVRDVQTKTEYGSSSLQEKVEGLAARLDEIVTRMDRALAPLEEFMRRQASSDTSAKQQGMGVDYYDAAMRDLSMGNYDLAEVGFLQYLEQYPKSDLADDARYGLAETYYARKRWAEAIEEYQRVVTMNPKGGKAAAAMLKIGLSQKADGKPRDARKTLEELIKQFPYADEAKVAQQRLDEIKGSKK
jgi:tol-pal system protein YbgF